MTYKKGIGKYQNSSEFKKEGTPWRTCDKAGYIEKDMFILSMSFFLALLQHLQYNIFENQSNAILYIKKYFVE